LYNRKCSQRRNRAEIDGHDQANSDIAMQGIVMQSR
jgi:hypothetical protein